MGFFKSLGQLNQQAKEIQRNSPSVKDQMADASARMQAANQMLAAQAQAATAAIDGDAGTGSITSLRPTGTLINFDQVYEVDLLVTSGARPPWSATVTGPVPAHALMRCVPGQTVPVKVDRTDATRVWIDWNSPA